MKKRQSIKSMKVLIRHLNPKAHYYSLRERLSKERKTYFKICHPPNVEIIIRTTTSQEKLASTAWTLKYYGVKAHLCACLRLFNTRFWVCGRVFKRLSLFCCFSAWWKSYSKLVPTQMPVITSTMFTTHHGRKGSTHWKVRRGVGNGEQSCYITHMNPKRVNQVLWV